jgi:hypothetical protein
MVKNKAVGIAQQPVEGHLPVVIDRITALDSRIEHPVYVDE